jgi:hypothetical protein
MEHREGDRVIRSGGTKRLGEVLGQMSASLADGGVPPFKVVTPDARSESVIEEMVLNEVEQADLVVIDLTDSRPNVAYEAAIIHTLGIPHILVSTTDSQPPFYFRNVQVILGLNLTDDFSADTRSASQLELFDKLRRFQESADERMKMAGNILTRHYGLPLVDLAGPAGLAVGYHINAVSRFIGPGGYSGRECNLTIEQKRVSRPMEMFKPRSKPVEVQALVVIEPPSLLRKSWGDDWKVVHDAFAGYGVEIERGSIELVGATTARGFSGWFYSGGIRRGKTFCVDLPTTVYPLKESPRMGRLAKLRSRFSGPQSMVIEEFEGRALERMLTSFKQNLFYHVQQVPNRRDDGFHYTDLNGLGGVLSKLGVTS